MTRRSWWRVDIERYERIPDGFGVAWWVVDRDECVCFRLGINVLAMWCRRFYVYLKNPGFSMTGDEAHRLAHLEQRMKGLMGDGR